MAVKITKLSFGAKIGAAVTLSNFIKGFPVPGGLSIRQIPAQGHPPGPNDPIWVDFLQVIDDRVIPTPQECTFYCLRENENYPNLTGTGAPLGKYVDGKGAVVVTGSCFL